MKPGGEWVGDGKRIKYDYKNTNLYVTISDDKGDQKPHSVKLSASGEEVNKHQSLLSDIDLIAELLTIAIRNEDLPYILSKMTRASRGQHTLAGILTDALWRWVV